MDAVKRNLKALLAYLVSFLKWIALSLVVGTVGGTLGSVFHICIDYGTELRLHHAFILLFMPMGGILITFMYRLLAPDGAIDTNLVISALRKNRRLPLIMIPLIFVSTVITQLVGASGGREGAALQLGGSMGYNVGRVLKMNDENMRIIVMSGMASVFSALFGTPLTASIFSLEVASVGALNFTALLPAIISSSVAFAVAGAFGISPVRFVIKEIPNLEFDIMARVIILALATALVSIIFCAAIEKCHVFTAKIIKNPYIRTTSLSVVLVAATLLLGTYDYNGAGMPVIERAMTGETRPEAFILKIIFTAITISAGFKGGEIVPAFFVGATFGSTLGALLGIDPVFGAAVGFVCLFCGVVNCPLASILLSVEVFGAEGILFFAAASAVSYAMSGKFGLYSSQRIVYSKVDGEENKDEEKDGK